MKASTDNRPILKQTGWAGQLVLETFCKQNKKHAFLQTAGIRYSPSRDKRV